MLLEWGLLAVLALVGTGLCFAYAVTRPADNLIYDALLRLDERPPRSDIVVAAIDNRSLQALGRWPWPRALQAEALGRLARYRPKAIAYDILLTEPDPDDGLLAAGLKAAYPVFLPVLVETPGSDGSPYRIVPPAAPERAAAAALGQANLDFDPDGVVRTVYLTEGDVAGQWPHLMQLVAWSAEGWPLPPASASPTVGPLRRGEPRLISYAGPPGHFPTVSLVDIYRGEIPDAVLRGKLVLVGASADGLGDRFPTPVSSNTEIMSGVELQANILDALLGGRLIRPIGRPVGVALSLVPLILLLGGFLRLRPWSNLSLGLGLMTATLLVSLVLFSVFRIWWTPVTALAALALVFPLWSWRRLAAASAYMVDELSLFEAEPDLLPHRAGAPAASDVIDRQAWLMHDAIRRARDLRQFMFDTIKGLPDATLVVDRAGYVRVANDQAECLFATLTGASPMGRSIEALVEVLTPVSGAGEPPDRPGHPGREGRFDGEYEAGDGACYHVRDIPFSDSGAAFFGRIVRFTDITEMRVAMRQREHALQLLSHDMRSPQISIIALLGQGDPAEAAPDDRLRRIGDYARRTLALADNFVQLARAENPSYAFERVNAADVLLDAIDDLWPQANARSIAVRAAGCEQEFLVRADRSLLTRVFINIIDNAIKYSDDDTFIDCAVSAGPQPAQVRMTVRDQGRGMTAEQCAHLFEPFHRAPQQGRRSVGGVGLGLVFVRTVIQRHGGTIDCDSRPGEGSTFVMTLPLAAAGPEAAD